MASDDNPFCGGLLLFFVGLLLLVGATQRFLLGQRIRNTPTSKVRSAAVGLVELFGRARAVEKMKSPISRAGCVYWRLHCEYYQPGKHGGWRDMYSPSSSARFFLEDETGRMLIEPQGAEIDIPLDFSTTGRMSEGGILGFFKNKTLGEWAFAFIENDANAKEIFSRYSSYELRITEYFIAEGDEVYVLGNASPLAGASSAVAHENLLIQKGAGPMYISDSGEKKVLSKVSGGIWWMLLLGLLLSSIGLFIMLSSFMG